MVRLRLRLRLEQVKQFARSQLIWLRQPHFRRHHSSINKRAWTRICLRERLSWTASARERPFRRPRSQRLPRRSFDSLLRPRVRSLYDCGEAAQRWGVLLL